MQLILLFSGAILTLPSADSTSEVSNESVVVHVFCSRSRASEDYGVECGAGVW